MSEQTTIDLSHFRLPKTATATRKGWTAPTFSALAEGWVLAYDQSLSNTGWVMMQHVSGRITIVQTGLFAPKAQPGLTSHEASFAKADRIAEASSFMCESWPHAIVYERPMVGGGHRTDSILLAGREIHRASRGRAVMVSNQHAKAVFIGRAKQVSKAQVKEAVEAYVDPPSSGWPWNEHVRDAVLLGLTYLYDLKQKEKAA